MDMICSVMRCIIPGSPWSVGNISGWWHYCRVRLLL